MNLQEYLSHKSKTLPAMLTVLSIAWFNLKKVGSLFDSNRLPNNMVNMLLRVNIRKQIDGSSVTLYRDRTSSRLSL